MAKDPAQLRRELQGLRQAFLSQLPARVRDIETAQNEALTAQDRDGFDALLHVAHRLCGAAGIYGYPAVHSAAGALERAAEELREAGGKGEPGQIAELRRLLGALKGAADAAGMEPPASE